MVFLAALLLFCINLDRPAHPDEMHHALAAQQLIETGRPMLDQGEYTRGIAYTWLVAISYEVFGEGLASARAPSVLIVALVAAILFAWVRREAGVKAAWITAGIFISSPFTVEIAQFCRFYSLHVLVFLLGTMCVYYLARAEVSLGRRILLSAMALVLFITAYWLQDTTLIGLVGVAVWVAGVLANRVIVDPALSASAKRTLFGVLVASGILVVLAATRTGWLESVWFGYRRTPLFSEPTRNDFWYYHLRYLILYPTLWSLVGFLAVAAMLQRARLAWFAATIFSISFLLQSFGGMKGTRYISYAVPYLSVIWGVGLASLTPMLSRAAHEARRRLGESGGLARLLGTKIGSTVVVVAVLLLALMNPFWLRSATMIANIPVPTETPDTDWPAAREALEWWTNNADIMITTEELGAIYFLGRSDVRYSPSKLGEIATRGQGFEFGIDWRTGRPVISKPESLRQLVECFSRGFIVGPIEHWGSPNMIGEATQAVLARHARPIEVPKESHLYAWGWNRAPQEPRPSYCVGLERFSGRTTR